MLKRAFDSWVAINKNVGNYLLRFNAPLAFFIAFIVGVVSLIAAGALGINQIDLAVLPQTVPDSGTADTYLKQVGYVWAINWSISLIIGFPAMFFFIRVAVRAANTSWDEMINRRMIVSESWAPLKRPDVSEHIERLRHQTAQIGSIVVLITLLWAVLEWYFVSGQHHIFGSLPLTGEFDELDWSVAAVLTEAGRQDVGMRIANGIFSLVVYLILGAYLAVVFSFYAFIVAYSSLVLKLDGRGGRQLTHRLIPDPDDEDSRRGFNSFERMFHRTLWVTLIGFLLGYFSHTQNLYLREFNVNYPNIGAFIMGDLSDGILAVFGGNFLEDGGELIVKLLEPGLNVNFTSGLVTFVVVGIFALILLALAWTLKDSAERARGDLSVYLHNSNSQPLLFTDISRKECLKRISPKEMVTWPLGWPSLRQLVIGLVFGALCIVFYRLGLFFAGVLLGRIIWIVFKSAIGRGDDTS